MPIRKPKRSYQELRSAVLSDKGLLETSDTQPTQPADETSNASPTEQPTETVEPVVEQPKQTPKLQAKPKPAAAKPKKVAKATLSNVEGQGAEKVTIRLTFPPLKPGVDQTYDDVAASMGEDVALKALAKKAVAHVNNDGVVNTSLSTDAFLEDRSKVLRTHRVLPKNLVEKLRKELDPHDVLSDYNLAMRIGQLVLLTYLSSEPSA